MGFIWIHQLWGIEQLTTQSLPSREVDLGRLHSCGGVRGDPRGSWVRSAVRVFDISEQKCPEKLVEWMPQIPSTTVAVKMGSSKLGCHFPGYSWDLRECHLWGLQWILPQLKEVQGKIAASVSFWDFTDFTSDAPGEVRNPICAAIRPKIGRWSGFPV